MKTIAQTITGAALAALATIAMATGPVIAAPTRQAPAAACTQASPDHDLLLAYRAAEAERCAILHDRSCDDPALAPLRPYLLQERTAAVPAELLAAPAKR